jgi:hypothetical protein
MAHLRSDVAEIKVDQRSMRDKMDSMNSNLLEKLAEMKDSIAAAKVWALILYFALAGAILATMARGFDWI